MKLLKDSTLKARESEITTLKEDVHRGEDNLKLLEESLMARLELALEDQSWQKLGREMGTELSQSSRVTINEMARAFWLKNPLIRRAIITQMNYVFGQGVEINSENGDVNEVIQSFLDDPKNKAEFTTHQMRMIKETELSLFANIYFIFFVHPITGKVRIRTIPVDEIHEIITDPEDNKTPMFYKRVFSKKKFNNTEGEFGEAQQITRYYKAWNITEKELAVVKKPKLEEAVIYHVSVNRLSDMKFGISEVYAATDWAKSYTGFLGDWSTIVKSYARFAWNLTSKNKTGLQAAKSKLSTTLSSSNSETNPAPATGSMFQTTEGSKLEPIKTAGATTSAKDGQNLIHMVSAATGIYYHYLTGDPSTGNLATAKSMERPMELQFKNRQQLWADVYINILNFVIDQSIKASTGKLKGAVDAEGVITLAGEEGRLINVKFPDILERDTLARVETIIKASTLDGKQLSNLIEAKVVARLMLEALGEKDIDEMINKMFDADGSPKVNAEQIITEQFSEMKEIIKNLNGNGIAKAN